MQSKGWIEFTFVYPGGEYFFHFHFFLYPACIAVALPVAKHLFGLPNAFLALFRCGWILSPGKSVSYSRRCSGFMPVCTFQNVDDKCVDGADDQGDCS